MYIPNDEKTKDALGDVKKEIRNERVRMVFEQDVVSEFFDRMVIKDPGEWIPATQQDSQNFDGYKMGGFNQLYQDRCTIYIQPLDSSVTAEFLEKCKLFGEAYYHGLPVQILKHKNIKKLKVASRGEGKYVQYLARDILRESRNWIPNDAYGMLGVTNYDLYPKDDWNFVFGLASLRDRTGVFSFARYDPNFFEDEEGEDGKNPELVIYRSIRVMTHETGHMFGIQHGVYYEGNMNGSMSAEESSGRPGHLCPIGLRKLWYNVGFDPIERYKALIEACDQLE